MKALKYLTYNRKKSAILGIRDRLDRDCQEKDWQNNQYTP